MLGKYERKKRKSPRSVDFCTVVPLNLGNHQSKKILIPTLCTRSSREQPLLAEDRREYERHGRVT